MDQPTRQARTDSGIGFAEFVTMIAAMMAMTALSIDSMLPALPAIGADLGVANPNERQWVIGAFMLSFGVAQIVHGPIADRYGRRAVLLPVLLLVVLFNLLAAVAGSFALLIAARVAAGMAVAGCRVLAVSIVRDRYAGRQMARVMSLAMIVFMAAPVIAPAVGQLILLVAPWRWIFAALAASALALLGWALLRLPETLPAELRVPISLRGLAAGAGAVLRDRLSLGYTLAQALLYGGLFGFINSIQQIFADVFAAPGLMTPMFALVAGTMAVASLVNARIVVAIGTRRISHGALVGYVLFSAGHVAVAASGHETLATFALLQAGTLASFGLAGANFGAMAMANMGSIAGMASSVQGFISTLVGASLGIAIGQAYDGSTLPLACGFLICGLAALVVVAVTERGRLFRPQA